MSEWAVITVGRYFVGAGVEGAAGGADVSAGAVDDEVGGATSPVV